MWKPDRITKVHRKPNPGGGWGWLLLAPPPLCSSYRVGVQSRHLDSPRRCPWSRQTRVPEDRGAAWGDSSSCRPHLLTFLLIFPVLFLLQSVLQVSRPLNKETWLRWCDCAAWALSPVPPHGAWPVLVCARGGGCTAPLLPPITYPPWRDHPLLMSGLGCQRAGWL